MPSDSEVPPSHFVDERIFEAEQKVLFERTWQLACLSTDVQRDKDYVAIVAGGIPMVVQNFRGKLAAVHNVCSHRNSPLQPEGRGSRGLHCPYHGWTYSADGIPIGIPHNEEFYGFTPAETRCLGAATFPLQTCGNLVFVCAHRSRSLVEQLGEWHPLLSSIGGALDDIYLETTFTAACNWKFLVHNAFDDIHAQFVHPTTSLDTSDNVSTSWRAHAFKPDLEAVPENYAKRHAQFEVEMTEVARRRNAATCGATFADPVFAFEQYLHFFLFPNVVITSIQGLWYNVVRYRPTSAGTTEITVWVVPARQKGSRSCATPEMLYELAFGSMRIFQEDVRAVECIQGVIDTARRPGVLGRREDKIMAFNAAYMSALSRHEPSAIQ